MRDDSEDGFTLVEVLVAFVILAGAIILSFQIFADGFRRAATVESRIKAVDVARSELARLSTSEIMPEGVTIGTTDGVAWKIEVKPVEGFAASGASAIRPFRVEVRTIDDSNKSGGMPIIETIVLGRAGAP